MNAPHSPTPQGLLDPSMNSTHPDRLLTPLVSKHAGLDFARSPSVSPSPTPSSSGRFTRMDMRWLDGDDHRSGRKRGRDPGSRAHTYAVRMRGLHPDEDETKHSLPPYSHLPFRLSMCVCVFGMHFMCIRMEIVIHPCPLFFSSFLVKDGWRRRGLIKPLSLRSTCHSMDTIGNGVDPHSLRLIYTLSGGSCQ